jgi:hypothetical protein
LGNRDHARNFWHTYRNGLLHAVSLNTKTRSTKTRSGMTLPPSSVSHDKPSCFLNRSRILLGKPRAVCQPSAQHYRE